MDSHRRHSTSSSTILRRIPLPDVVRPDSCFWTLLPSDSRRLDAVSGIVVTAPGGPRARRFLLTQPLRAVL